MSWTTVFDQRIFQAARDATERLPVEISMKPLTESYRNSVARSEQIVLPQSPSDRPKGL